MEKEKFSRPMRCQGEVRWCGGEQEEKQNLKLS